MNGLTVIIPSRRLGNLSPCLSELLQNDPRVRIIVVDDGIEFPGAELRMFVESHALMIAGAKPFIYARNVNLGIQAAGTDDVVLLNDDALLQTPGGLTAMQWFASEHPEYGLISSSCNNVGNPNQWLQPGGDVRDDPRMVCFVCVLIPRRTIDQVGLLDESFTGYGYDDDDYCLRVRNAGLKIGIFDGCFVDHSKLRSTFRGDTYPVAAFEHNRCVFERKWGAGNHQL